LDTTQVKKKHKILVVDDEKKVLIVARKIFRSAGYDVEVCLGPEEAAEIVANRGPVAVLFTDDRMPGMRGTELLEQSSTRAKPFALSKSRSISTRFSRSFGNVWNNMKSIKNRRISKIP